MMLSMTDIAVAGDTIDGWIPDDRMLWIYYTMPNTMASRDLPS